MGRGGGGDFARQERDAAHNFARMALAEGVERVIYLGGLGDEPGSKHLRSRHETALTLRRDGPPLTYFRAGMVVGARSEGYRTLRYLVERLPAMIAPAWLKTPTQPIGIDDAVAYLAAAPHVRASAAREVQIGGPDVLPYGEMLDRMARLARPPPAPEDPGPAADPVALVALDRPRHAGRRRCRASARRGPVDGDRRHRSVGHWRSSTSSRRASTRRCAARSRRTRRPARDSLPSATGCGAVW